MLTVAKFGRPSREDHTERWRGETFLRPAEIDSSVNEGHNAVQASSRQGKNMRSATLALSSALCSFTLGSVSAAPSPVKADSAAIAASIASPERLPDDREQDTWRKPEALLTFLGARPGMQVIDYLAGEGYYSELLARI